MATLLRILKHRVVITLLALLGIAVALELAAPPAIRSFTVDWLHDHGVADARIGAVRINPFTWSMSVHNLKAGPGLQVGRASINIDWWPLWHHQIYVWDVELDHAHLELVQNQKGIWQIAGLTMPAAPAMADHAKPWYPILHRAKLQDVHILLSGRDLKLDVPIQSLDIDHAFLSQAGNQILNTSLRLGPSSFSGLGYRYAGAGLQLHGQLVLPGPGASIDDAGTRNVTVKLHDVQLRTAKGDRALAVSQARISDIAVNGPDRIKLGDAEADDVVLQADIPGATDTKVGHVEARALQYVKGNIDLDALQVKNIRSTDASRKVNLGAVAGIAMASLSVDRNLQATLASLTIRGITLPATQEHAMGKIGGISITDARLSPSRSVQASRLDIRGLNLSILHDQHGLAELGRLKSGSSQPGPSKSGPSQPRPASKKKTAAAKPAAGTAAPALPSVHIEHVSIDKGSKIAFEDDAVDPPVQDELEVETFDFAPLQFGGKQPGTIDAAFRIGDQGSLVIKGDMNLDRANPMAKLTVNLKRLSMPPLSGYLAKNFGYTIGTGQMDVDSQISIHDQAISAKNKLAIRSLDLNATRQSDKATQSVGMPLDMAVSMLENDRGDISLNVPVSGRLDDPNVNINDAINQALATAIKSGAMSYASLLLQPYGSILPALSLAKGLLAEASKPRMTPISFAPRTASLSDEAKAYIGKIALLLKQKPFRLQACGVASQAEVEAESQGKQSSPVANNKRLLSLADARSTAVIKALAAAGISPDRIFECQPKIDTKANAPGRVELLLN